MSIECLQRVWRRHVQKRQLLHLALVRKVYGETRALFLKVRRNQAWMVTTMHPSLNLMEVMALLPHAGPRVMETNRKFLKEVCGVEAHFPLCEACPWMVEHPSLLLWGHGRFSNHGGKTEFGGRAKKLLESARLLWDRLGRYGYFFFIFVMWLRRRQGGSFTSALHKGGMSFCVWGTTALCVGVSRGVHAMAHDGCGASNDGVSFANGGVS